jgi:hypothetical protein
VVDSVVDEQLIGKQHDTHVSSRRRTAKGGGGEMSGPNETVALLAQKTGAGHIQEAAEEGLP